MKLKVSTPYSISISAALLISVSFEAAGQCPGACHPYSKPTGSNLLLNPTFDNVGPCGGVTWYQTGSGNCGAKSAAADWNIHASNACTSLAPLFRPTTLPQEVGGKFRMLHIQSRGSESGVYQVLRAKGERQ
jgi:hypothetical protein